jgi:hypothetical protein
MKTQEYKEGYELKEGEYLLKIRPPQACWQNEISLPTGFMTKFNKDGSVPVNFKSWGHRYGEDVLPILVFKETFREGWKLRSWRFGKSQQWASLVHPDGFTVEIYLSQFLDIVKEFTIIKGEIQGEFKWEDNRLISKNN